MKMTLKTIRYLIILWSIFHFSVLQSSFPPKTFFWSSCPCKCFHYGIISYLETSSCLYGNHRFLAAPWTMARRSISIWHLVEMVRYWHILFACGKRPSGKEGLENGTVCLKLKVKKIKNKNKEITICHLLMCVFVVAGLQSKECFLWHYIPEVAPLFFLVIMLLDVICFMAF